MSGLARHDIGVELLGENAGDAPRRFELARGRPMHVDEDAGEQLHACARSKHARLAHAMQLLHREAMQPDSWLVAIHGATIQGRR